MKPIHVRLITLMMGLPHGWCYIEIWFHPFVRSHQGAILLKALDRGISILWTHLFSKYVYIGPSPREREKEERNDRRQKMSKQPPPAPTASAVGPCPTLIQISRTPRHWKFTQPTTTPPLPPPNPPNAYTNRLRRLIGDGKFLRKLSCNIL